MPNIKVGGKVYRDVQKMDANQLHEVRSKLVQEQMKVALSAQKLIGKPNMVALIGRYQSQDQQLAKRIAIVDNFAKQIFKKAIPEVPKHYTEPEQTDEQTATATAGA
jgi:hypothetical protein